MAAKKKVKTEIEPLRLDLGCGQNKREGFKGVDIEKVEGVDYVVDLFQFPWPFEDSSVDEIHMSHFVEHVPDLCKFMNEIYRICKNEAIITSITPYYTSIRAWQDPTHVRAISEVTYYYFSKEWREVQKLDHYPVEGDFEVVNISASFNSPWDMKSEEAREFARVHYFNVISDITAILKVKK